jgi:hypothetical protein
VRSHPIRQHLCTGCKAKSGPARDPLGAALRRRRPPPGQWHDPRLADGTTQNWFICIGPGWHPYLGLSNIIGKLWFPTGTVEKVLRRTRSKRRA